MGWCSSVSFAFIIITNISPSVFLNGKTFLDILRTYFKVLSRVYEKQEEEKTPLGKILEQSQSSETKRNTKREEREPGIEAGLNPDDGDDEDFPQSKEFCLRPFFNTVL